MERVLFALSLGFVGVILATGAGFAAPCGPRDLVIGQLSERWGENRRSVGIAANGQVMELYASAATGTWTIVVTLPDGRTCLIASGEGFEPVAEDLPAKGSPV